MAFLSDTSDRYTDTQEFRFLLHKVLNSNFHSLPLSLPSPLHLIFLNRSSPSHVFTFTHRQELRPSPQSIHRFPSLPTFYRQVSLRLAPRSHHCHYFLRLFFLRPPSVHFTHFLFSTLSIAPSPIRAPPPRILLTPPSCFPHHQLFHFPSTLPRPPAEDAASEVPMATTQTQLPW